MESESGSLARTDKIAGAVYGQALGDAMGMPMELWSPEKVREFYGSPVVELLDGPAENEIGSHYKRGQFTDDTAQALILLDSLASTTYIPNADDAARRLLEWADSTDAFSNGLLGPTSRRALEAFRDGKDTAEIAGAALSNGAAMRIGPVGAILDFSDPEGIANFVYQLSKVTHMSDVAIAGAAMIAGAVASAIVHDDFDEVLEDALSAGKAGMRLGVSTDTPDIIARATKGIGVAQRHISENISSQKFSDLDRVFLDEIYATVGAGVPVVESVPAALAIAYYARDPERSAVLCANLGGDTDTIGAMATSICGAFTGASKIRDEWRRVLRTANHVDFDWYIGIIMNGRKV